MDIGAIFILLALIIVISMYLAQPYMEKRTQIVSASELELSALFAKRDQTISALKELELDNSLGKVPADDYPAQHAYLMKQGAEIMRMIDAFKTDNTDTVKDRLERAIDSRRAEIAPVDDDIESMISARRRQRKAKSGGFCPNCGHPVLSGDKFCTKCGKKA